MMYNLKHTTVNKVNIFTLGCDKQLDVVLVLDFSGSVHHVYDIILEFAKRLIENFNIDSGDVRIGVVSFSNRANIQFRLDEYKTKKANLNAIYGRSKIQTT